MESKKTNLKEKSKFFEKYCNCQSKPKFAQRKSIQLQDAFFV